MINSFAVLSQCLRAKVRARSRALQAPLGSVVRSALSRLIAFSRVVCFFHPKKLGQKYSDMISVPSRDNLVTVMKT